VGKGTNALARAIMMAAGNVYDGRFVPVMLGTISGDMSLMLDNEIKIPSGDYLVAEYLTMQEDYFTNTESAEKVLTPQALKPLKPGDRVICLPLLDGDDIVVIGRVK
jgi:hypothetical protein